MFDKKALFAYDDTKIEKVECPEWGDLGKEIYVRTMSSKSRDTYEMGIVEAGKQAKEARENGTLFEFTYNMRAEMAVGSICDKDGNLLFETSDAKELGKKSAGVLDRIFTVAKRLSHFSEEDVEEMEKSLESGAN